MSRTTKAPSSCLCASWRRNPTGRVSRVGCICHDVWHLQAPWQHSREFSRILGWAAPMLHRFSFTPPKPPADREEEEGKECDGQDALNRGKEQPTCRWRRLDVG